MAFGIERATIDGIAVDVAEMGDFSVAVVKRGTVEVLAGNHGKNVKKAVPFVEFTILLDGVRSTDFIGKDHVDVQLDGSDGVSYLWKDAHEVGDGTQNLGDGKLKLRYESDEAGPL